MPNWLINLGAKLSGISKLWGVLNGYKTKIAGTAGLLTGIAGILGDLIPLIEKQDAAALLQFLKSIPSNPHWTTVIGGLAVLGLGHKGEKTLAAATAAAAPKP